MPDPDFPSGQPTVIRSQIVAAGMQAVPGLTLARHDGPFGNALLTKRKILEVRRLALGYGRREPRNALDVDLEVSGQRLRVIVTHLGLFAAERRWQVKKLPDLVRHTPAHERVIVLGDINEWMPLSRPLRWMNSLLGRSVAERSFPSKWPRGRLRPPARQGDRRHPEPALGER